MVGQWGNGTRLACASVGGIAVREIVAEQSVGTGYDGHALCSENFVDPILTAATGWHGGERFIRCTSFIRK
jgi:hypothetical protein